jgi:hypothetical protein
MRILTSDRVLFRGEHLCPEFDCPRGLPDKLEVLLCLLDGAERRKHLQAKLNRLAPGASAAAGEEVHQKSVSASRK